MVNAIIRHKGGDQFAKEHRGLHCGIRKHCVPYYDNDESTAPSGVEIVEILEGAADMSGMRYHKPLEGDLPALSNLALNQLEFLLSHLVEDVDGEWNEVSEAIAIRIGEAEEEGSGDGQSN